MSDHVYRVRYDRRLLSARTKSTHKNFQKEIRGLLRSLGAAPLPDRRQVTSTGRIKAIAFDQAITRPIILPEGMMEVPVPEDLTDPEVHGETLLLTPVNESELMVTIANPGIQTTECDKIVVNLAKRIYEKSTGKKVSPNEVIVEKVGMLSHSICKYCKRELRGLPYRCQLCGRTYCRDHIPRAEHQCPVAGTKVNVKHQVRPRIKEAKTQSSDSRTKIKIGRVPCG